MFSELSTIPDSQGNKVKNIRSKYNLDRERCETLSTVDYAVRITREVARKHERNIKSAPDRPVAKEKPVSKTPAKNSDDDSTPATDEDLNSQLDSYLEGLHKIPFCSSLPLISSIFRFSC